MDELRELHLRGATGAVRMAAWNGTEHMVVPVVALMEGVIHAINADVPEYVPIETLSHAPQMWNNKPAVLKHPVKDGKQISANHPRVLESQGLGSVFSTEIKDKKLVMEAYIDPVKAEKLGAGDMIRRLRAGETVEVSVGAYVVTEPRAGEHNGKQYKAIWKQIHPDHLAFLPEGIGACSVKMGCGTRAAESYLVTAEGFEEIDPRHAHSITDLAGKGRGDWGHKGRPGHVGGSGSGDGGNIADWAIGFAGKIGSALDLWMSPEDHAKLKKIVEQGGKVKSITTEADEGKFSAWRSKQIDSMKAKGYKLFGSEDNYDSREMVFVKGGPRRMESGDDGDLELDFDPITGEQEEEFAEKWAEVAPRVLAGGDHPFTYCMEHVIPAMAREGKEPSDPKAFCGWWKAEYAEAHVDDAEAVRALEEAGFVALGGPGSGNFGHSGRPGHVGGSGGGGDEGDDEQAPIQDVTLTEERAENRHDTHVASLEAAGYTKMSTRLSRSTSVRTSWPVGAIGRYDLLEHPKIGRAEVVSRREGPNKFSTATHLLGRQFMKVAAAALGITVEHAEAYFGDSIHAAGEKPCGCRGGSEMDKELKAGAIKLITETKGTGFGVDDVKTLEAWPDKMIDNLKILTESKIAADKAAEEQKKAELKAAAEKAPSYEEWSKTAPPEVRTLVEKYRQLDASKKKEIIGALKVAQSAYTEKELEAMDVEQLERLALVAKVDYSGKGIPVARRAEGTEDVFLNPPDGYAIALKARAAGEQKVQ